MPLALSNQDAQEKRNGGAGNVTPEEEASPSHNDSEIPVAEEDSKCDDNFRQIFVKEQSFDPQIVGEVKEEGSAQVNKLRRVSGKKRSVDSSPLSSSPSSFLMASVDVEEGPPPAKITKRGGHYCCVMGCNKNTKTDKPAVKFFCIPAASRNAEQRECWLKAINRAEDDGSPWIPKPKAIVCSRQSCMISPILKHNYYVI